jgi:glycosyltransferase involved in cell wall biosynthesis
MIKNNLTIIIPSKNERYTLYECINHIAKQNNILGTKVIIADVSDTELSIAWLNAAKYNLSNYLDIEIIEGGYPAKGRLEGSKLAKTPYILFLDADIMLTKPDIIEKSLSNPKDLTTVKFHTDKPYNIIFRIFDMFQILSSVLGTPFAVGGYQLWNTKAYWNVGGYNENELFAEDYSISQKVKPKNFKIQNIKGVYTSPRRFKNKGLLFMFKILIATYINRNNPNFFTRSHGYWD